MKQTLGIVRYNFFGFFRNPKVIFTLFLEFVLSFLLTGRIMVVMDNYNTPVQAIEPFLWTFGDGTAVLLSSMLLLFCYSLTLSFVILVGNLSKGKTKGMIAGLFYSIYGFLLDPNVLAAVLHKEKYEMYQINVLICWISPLNQAVYGKHNLGYDPLLPKLWQSCVFFLILVVILVILALRRMKKYPFEFLGEKS